MATNNQNQKSEEPEPFLMPSPKQEKDVITAHPIYLGEKTF